MEYRAYNGGYFRILTSSAQTKGAMSVIEITLPRGVEPPPHVHSREDESFYLLEGSIDFTIGDKRISAVVGDYVFAPRHIPHHFSITSDHAKFLTIMTPGELVNFFLEFSAPATALTIQKPEGSPPAELIQQITQRLTMQYGLMFSNVISI